MPKILDRWTVFPHGPVERIGERLLTVSGDIPMPLAHFPRRMTAIGLAGDRTAIWSAMALEEPAMAQIESLGRPSFLVVPSGFHRMDIRIWKERYPEMNVVTPPGAEPRVREIVPVDATTDILDDPAVDFAAVPGTKGRESALIVREKEGTTLIVNDVIGHVRHPKGLATKLLTRLLGFGASGPQVPRDVKRMLVEDPKALAGQFRAWAAEPDLRRIIVSHGDPIVKDPGATLRTLAKRLD